MESSFVRSLQAIFELVHVFVTINPTGRLLVLCRTKAHTIDNRCMVEFVANDDIFIGEEEGFTEGRRKKKEEEVLVVGGVVRE